MIRTIFTLGAIITGIVMLIYLGVSEKKEPDAKRIFTSNEIVWYGLDFTKAHFVGTFDQGMGIDPADGNDLRTKWIPAWNNLFISEPRNFDLRRSFRKNYVYYDITSVNRLNEKLDQDALLSSNETRINEGMINEMVKQYTGIEKKEGLGLVFIIENFNKNTKTAGLYVTFFDIATKKVLMSEYMAGSPVGFGLRNYWAGAIKNILNWIDFYEYNKWKRKYYNIPSDEQTVENGIINRGAKKGSIYVAYPALSTF